MSPRCTLSEKSGFQMGSTLDSFQTWGKSCPGFPTLGEVEEVLEEHDLPPIFVPPVMLVREPREQGQQARGPQAPAGYYPFQKRLLLPQQHLAIFRAMIAEIVPRLFQKAVAEG